MLLDLLLPAWGKEGRQDLRADGVEGLPKHHEPAYVLFQDIDIAPCIGRDCTLHVQ